MQAIKRKSSASALWVLGELDDLDSGSLPVSKLTIPPRDTITAKSAEATKLRGAASQPQLEHQNILANREKKSLEKR